MSLKLSDTRVYEPQIRARLGTQISAVPGSFGTSMKTLINPEREFVIDNLLVRIHFIIAMTWLTGLAPRGLKFPYETQISAVPKGFGTSMKTLINPDPEIVDHRTFLSRFRATLKRGASKFAKSMVNLIHF